jgi:hypothetical protein
MFLIVKFLCSRADIFILEFTYFKDDISGVRRDLTAFLTPPDPLKLKDV